MFEYAVTFSKDALKFLGKAKSLSVLNFGHISGAHARTDTFLLPRVKEVCKLGILDVVKKWRIRDYKVY